MKQIEFTTEELHDVQLILEMHIKDLEIDNVKYTMQEVNGVLDARDLIDINNEIIHKIEGLLKKLGTNYEIGVN